MKHSVPGTLLKHLLPFHTDVQHWELKHHRFRNIFKKRIREAVIPDSTGHLAACNYTFDCFQQGCPYAVKINTAWFQRHLSYSFHSAKDTMMKEKEL